MREAIPEREGAIRVLPFVYEPDERVLALETLEPFLDLLPGKRQHGGENRRVEINAVNGGGTEQLAVLHVERVHLPLHEAANRFGQPALQLAEARGQHPAPVVLRHHAATAQVAKGVGHEERMALRAAMNDARK